jgi:formylglycine-generating enzyme
MRAMEKTGFLALALIVVVSVVLEGGAQQPATTNSVGMSLVLIEPGIFRMGREGSRDTWEEQPAHEVTISQPFLISATEVTQDQFRQFKPDFLGTASFAPIAAGRSWDDARAFTEWLSRKEGRPYRLPTEAGWEYVARTGFRRSAAAGEGTGGQGERLGRQEHARWRPGVVSRLVRRIPAREAG